MGEHPSGEHPLVRVSGLRLPLDHDTAALHAAITARLGVRAADILGFDISRRTFDAPTRADITVVYTVDVALRDAAGLRRSDAPADPAAGEADPPWMWLSEPW